MVSPVPGKSCSLVVVGRMTRIIPRRRADLGTELVPRLGEAFAGKQDMIQPELGIHSPSGMWRSSRHSDKCATIGVGLIAI